MKDMNRLLIILCAGLLASVTLVTDAGAQEYKSLRTKTWSIYGQGGVSYATGVAMTNVNPSAAMSIAPAFGGGVNYNLRPWIRFGLNYEFSQYRREQRFGEFQPVPTALAVGQGITELVTNEGGIAYGKMWTMYHSADLTFEFNLAQILANKRTCGRFNLYLGVGAGMLYANGNNYTLGMGYERWVDPTNQQAGVQVKDNWASRAWVTGENVRHKYDAIYFPGVLWAEYDVSPRVTIGLKGQYKYMFSPDHAMAPEAICSGAFTLRYNFLGAKHRTYKRKYNDLTATHSALQKQYDTYVGNADKAKADADRAMRELSDENEALKRQLAAAPPTAKVAAEVPGLSVLFEVGSAVISKEQATRLKIWAEYLRNNKFTISLVGEASADGSTARNQKLSEQRLANVIEMLKSYGIGSDRIKPAEAIGDANKVYQRQVEITVNE